MSRIDDLIAVHCPDGVEYEPLGNLVQNHDNMRRPVTRSNRRAGEYPYYGANGIQDYVDDYLFDGTYLLVGEDGSVIQADGSPVVNWAVGKIWVNNHAHVLASHDDNLELRFLFHLLQAIDVRPYVTGGSQLKINQGNLNRIPIPVPPLEVQNEIVRILDTFAELEVELEAALEAELMARRQQHDLYRHRIIADIAASSEPISDLGRWYGGVTPSKAEPRFWESGSIPWLASMDVSDTGSNDIRGRVTSIAIEETSLRIIPSPSVVVVMRSNILRRRLPIGLVTTDTTVNQDVRALVPREGVDAQYVYQVLRALSEDIRASCVRTDGSMAAVESKNFLAYQIPLPPYEDQQRIADKLRFFDTLVNDLSIELPAELNARRQQYEYYRDRLLTFEEKPA